MKTDIAKTDNGRETTRYGRQTDIQTDKAETEITGEILMDMEEAVLVCDRCYSSHS